MTIRSYVTLACALNDVNILNNLRNFA